MKVFKRKITIAFVFVILFFTNISTLIAAEKNFYPESFNTLQDCITTASNWGVSHHGTGIVVFSGQTYTVSKSLNLGSNVQLQGTVRGKKTILNYTGDQANSDTDFIGVLSISANKTSIQIRNIDFTRNVPGSRGGGFSGIFRADVVVKVTNPVSNIKIIHCKAINYTALYESANMAKWSDGIEIGNCEAINNQAYFIHIITTKNLNFHDNKIEQVNVDNESQKYLHAGSIFRAVQNVICENNTLNVNGGGRAFNGFLFESMPPLKELGGNQGASNINLKIAGNKICRTKEEGIIIERSRALEFANMANVVSGTTNTITKNARAGYGTKGIKTWTTDCWKDLTFVIVNGKGLGQVRMVTANSANTLTVDKNWDVIPDTTSVFSVMHHTDNVLIDNNTINNTGKASIAPYMCCGTRVTNNIMFNCQNHHWDAATIEMMVPNVAGEFGDNNGLLWPNYNNVIANNTINQEQSMIGIRVVN